MIVVCPHCDQTVNATPNRTQGSYTCTECGLSFWVVSLDGVLLVLTNTDFHLKFKYLADINRFTTRDGD